VLHTAARVADFVRAHGGVTDKDQFVVAAKGVDKVVGGQAAALAAAIVFPHRFVDAVVEVVILQVLEFAFDCGKQLFHRLDVVVHRAAHIKQHQYLHRIAQFAQHFQLEQAGIACGSGNGAIQIQHFFCPLAGEFAQAAQGQLDVAAAQFGRIVEIAEFALVPHLYCAAVARAILANTDAFRVVAIGAKRAGAAGAYPFVAALMAFFLFLQPLAQGVHQLVPAQCL